MKESPMVGAIHRFSEYLVLIVAVMWVFSTTTVLASTPPVANAGADMYRPYGAVVTLDGSGSSDADGSISDYAWTQVGGQSVNLVGAQTVSPAFALTQNGTLVFKLQVTDNDGDTGVDTVAVIAGAPKAPVADAGEDGIAWRHVSLSLNGAESSDADGVIASYVWAQINGTLPAYAQMHQNGTLPFYVTAQFNGSMPIMSGWNTATPSYTPTVAGKNTFLLMVTDNDGFTSLDDVIIDVIDNDAPIADAGSDQDVVTGTQVTLDGSNSSDPDDSIVAYSWSKVFGPTVSLSGANTDTATFTPTIRGKYVFSLTVTDIAGATASDLVTVIVSPPTPSSGEWDEMVWDEGCWDGCVESGDQAPVANAGNDATAKFGIASSLDGSSSYDPDGSIVAYEWTQISGETVPMENADTVSPAFTLTSNGTFGFRLQVTDNDNYINYDSVVITSTAAVAPIADAGDDALGKVGESTTLDGSGSSDPDGAIASYVWAQKNGTTMVVNGWNTVTPTLHPFEAGSYLFTLTVTDNDGFTNADNVIVTVKENVAPVADAGVDQDGVTDVQVTLNGANSADSDGSIASYFWEQTFGPGVTLNGANTASPTFTPTIRGTYIFSLTVTDDSGAASPADTVTVTVEPPVPASGEWDVFVWDEGCWDGCLQNGDQPPVASAGEDHTAKLGIQATLDGSGSYDPDGSIAAYEWVQIGGESVTLTDADTVSPAFTLTQNGTYTFRLQVTDNDNYYAYDQVAVTAVTPTPPVADAGDDINGKVGKLITMSGAGSSDADGVIAAYVWAQMNGTTVVLTGEDTATPTFTPTEAGQYGFSLTVTDDDGFQDLDDIVVDVAALVAPVANAGQDQGVRTGTQVTLSAAQSSDEDGTIESYSWVQDSGPNVSLAGADTMTATFTPVEAGVYGFTLTVTDDDGKTDTDVVTVTATPPPPPSGEWTVFKWDEGCWNGCLNNGDQAPIASAGDDQSVKVGVQVTLSGASSSDSDGAIASYLWSQVGGPVVSMTGASSQSATFTPTQAGTYVYTLTVTDNDGYVAYDNVVVHVAALQAPVASAGATQNVKVNRLVTLSGAGSTDADGTIQTYAWAKTSGPDVNLSGADSDTLTFTPTDAGTYIFTLTVTDDDGLTGSASVSVIVAANIAPVADAGDDQNTDAGELVTLNGAASNDPDGSIASYAWEKSSGPTISLSDATAAQPTFTPMEGGTYVFTLTVTDDDNETGTDSVSITVAPFVPPVADAGTDQGVKAERLVTLNGAASSDADGSIVSYAWVKSSGPSTSLSGASTATPSFTPTIAGTYVFTLTVTDDDNQTDTDSVTVIVAPLIPPTAQAGADQTCKVGKLATLNGAGTDSDGVVVSYAWAQTSGAVVSLSGANTQNASFTPTTPGVYEFTLTVTDDDNRTDTDTVRVTANALVAPVANAGADKNAVVGVQTALSAAGSSDADGSIVSYSWAKTSGPSVSLSGAASASPTFTPATVGAYVFTLTVTDDDGKTGTDSVTVTAYAAPIAEAGANQDVIADTLVTLDGAGSSDSDGTITTYTWSVVSAPAAVSLSGADASTATFTPKKAGVYVVKLTVTDNDGLTGSDTVSITVAAPPVALATWTSCVSTGALVILDGAKSYDPDGAIVSYAWRQLSGPTASLTNANTHLAIFNPAQGGDYLFQLTVTDNAGLNATVNAAVKVYAAKEPPKAIAGPNRHVSLANPVTLYGGNSFDRDGQIVTYLWEQELGAEVALSGANTAAATFTPETTGVYKFKLTVTDNDGLTDFDFVVIMAAAAKTPPEANAGPNQQVKTGASVSLNGANSFDRDGSITSYEWTQVKGPAVNIGGSTSAIASFTPTSEGVYQFQLTVTDNDGFEDSDTVNVIATDTKTPPVAAAGPNQHVKSGVTVTLNGGNSYDRDGAISSYEWRQLDGEPVVMSGKTAALMSFTPTEEGVYRFQLTVADNDALEASDTVIVTVADDKTPPVCLVWSDQAGSGASSSRLSSAYEDSVSTSVTVTLDGRSSVANSGSSLQYAWKQLSGTPVTLSGADTAQPSFTTSTVGAYSFQLTVTDGDGLSARAILVVNVVTGDASAPVADAGEDITVKPGSSVSLDGGGSYDTDGAIVEFSWKQIVGPTVTLSGQSSSVLQFSAETEGGYVFELTVTDDSGLNNTDTVIVNVTNGSPPVANAGDNVWAEEGETVTLNGAASSYASGAAESGGSYVWSQVQGEAVVLSGANTSSASFAAPSSAPATFTLMVTDSSGLMASDTVQFSEPEAISVPDMSSVWFVLFFGAVLSVGFFIRRWRVF